MSMSPRSFKMRQQLHAICQDWINTMMRQSLVSARGNLYHASTPTVPVMQIWRSLKLRKERFHQLSNYSSRLKRTSRYRYFSTGAPFSKHRFSMSQIMTHSERGGASSWSTWRRQKTMTLSLSKENLRKIISTSKPVMASEALSTVACLKTRASGRWWSWATLRRSTSVPSRMNRRPLTYTIK